MPTTPPPSWGGTCERRQALPHAVHYRALTQTAAPRSRVELLKECIPCLIGFPEGLCQHACVPNSTCVKGPRPRATCPPGLGLGSPRGRWFWSHLAQTRGEGPGAVWSAIWGSTRVLAGTAVPDPPVTRPLMKTKTDEVSLLWGGTTAAEGLRPPCGGPDCIWEGSGRVPRLFWRWSSYSSFTIGPPKAQSKLTHKGCTESFGRSQLCMTSRH